MFSVWSMPRCYEQDESRVSLVVGQLPAGKNISKQSSFPLGCGKCVKTWRTQPHPNRKKDGGTPGLTRTLSRNHSGRAALRNRRSSWRVITLRTKSQGRKARPITDVISTGLRKEEMAIHSLKEGEMWHVDPLLAYTCNKGTAMEKPCFLCGPCRGVVSRISLQFSYGTVTSW